MKPQRREGVRTKKQRLNAGASLRLSFPLKFRDLFFRALLPVLLLFSACSVFGVHYKIHNPHRAGKYPKATEARKLLGNQESKFRTCFDVTYYYLSVHFGKDLETEKGISGTVGINAIAKTDFDTLQLDLHKDMQLSAVHEGSVSGTGMAVDSDLRFFRKDNAVFVIFPAKVHAGESISMIADFSGIPQEAKKAPWSGGFVRKEDELKNPWWGVACETEGASLWWPCKDVVNDEPDSVDIDLWVPEGFTAVSNGKKVDPAKRFFSGTPGEDHSLEPWCWHVSRPINNYDISFYIGKYKLLQDEYISAVTKDTMQLNHYVLEQHYEKAKKQFPQAKKVLAFYEETFGPYAFYSDGYKLVESPYEGMEHQSAIAYGAGFTNTNFGFDYIILHETAHEWWGNAVTAYDLGDGWLHEGFATYCEALYVEKNFGHNAYLAYLAYNRLMIVNRRPVSHPYGIRYFDYRDEDIYMKGTWVLHSLRYAIGNDSLFFDVLRTFYSDYKYKNATTGNFQNLVNEKTGKDFKWFFDQYCYNRFVPELEYEVSHGKLYYRWAKTGNDFNMPVNVTFISGEWMWQQKLSTSGNTVQCYTATSAPVLNWNTGEFLFKPVKKRGLARAYRKMLPPIDHNH